MNDDKFPKQWALKEQASKGVQGHHALLGNVLDLNSLKSSSLGVWVILKNLIIFLKGALSHYLTTFKTNDLVLFLKTFWRYWNCFLPPVAKDGMDGNGLKLKKIGQFFKFWCYLFQKSSRNLLWLALSTKIHLISSS